jgi:catechol 2,3-dioxygenase-like lactoylglutathione lyase family enzyme
MTDLDLDHVGIAVRDLDAADAQYQRLGFRLTPRGYHTLPPPQPGAERPRVGTGNNCAMLKRGYIELIGITDPGYVGRLRDDLARYEGLHIVAFGTADSGATAQVLRHAGVRVPDPSILERPIEHAGGSELARFEIVDFSDALPEIYAFAIHHATPHALWKPELLEHPNGVQSLEAITIAVPDIGEFAARLGRVVGRAPVGEGALTVGLERGAVLIVGRDWLAATYDGPPLPLPAVAAMTLGTASLDQTAEALRSGGVPFQRYGGSLIVAPADACGAMIEFIVD